MISITPLTVYFCVFSCIKYIPRRKIVGQISFFLNLISKFFDGKLENDNVFVKIHKFTKLQEN